MLSHVLRGAPAARRPDAVRLAARCVVESLERRALLSSTVGSVARAPDVAALPGRSLPTADSVFRGEFVVTFVENTSPNAVARKFGADSSPGMGQGRTRLLHFGKGANASSLKKKLLRDQRVVDAYAVYRSAGARPSEAQFAAAAAADSGESEPNNTAGTATIVAVSSTPNIVSGSMAGADIDFFQFTLAQRSGVFIDVDCREIGLSATLDTIVELYDSTGTAQINANDDGRDFDTLPLNETTDTDLPFGDSALYQDLAPGTYLVKLYAPAGGGDYQLKFTADNLYTSSVPVLSSHPGAADTVYLDFDGHAATDPWGTYAIAAYDLNGNASEWTPAERKAIEYAWKVVADAYSPFNINVTTSYAGAYADGVAHRHVIGNSDGSEVGEDPGTRGVAWFNGYNSGGASHKTGFTFADNFVDPGAGISGEIVANSIEIGNTTVHEIGHIMGLEHFLGAPHRGAFMHTPDFGLNRSRWNVGTNAASQSQDDVAVISSPTNTFGYRSDDHGNTRPTATVLAASGNAYSASGVIHQTGDADYFRFNGSGGTTVTLDIPEHLYHLDSELYLYDSAGVPLGSADAVNTLGGAIALTLPGAGDYFVEVRSDGGTGEIGMYDLRITTTVGAAATGAISGRTFRDVTLNNVYEPGAGDVFLGNVTVFLDTDNDSTLDPGETSTISSALDGTYSFTGLANGSYSVKEITPAGYVENISYNIIISSGEAYPNADFGNFPIVYSGGPGGDSYTVRLKSGDATRTEIVESGSGLTYSALKALIPSLTFNTNDGDDLLTISYANGNPIPATSGIVFNGGNNATSDPGDRFIADGSSAAETITFDSSGASGGIVLNGVERATVNGGDGNDILTIAAAASFPVTFNGGTNPSFDDTLNLNAPGTYTFADDAQIGTAHLVLNVAHASASVIFNATQHLRSFNLSAGVATLSQHGSRVLVAQSLSITGGRLDLKNNKLITSSALGTWNGTAYTGVAGLVDSGRGSASNAQWNGNGIVTTDTRAVNNNDLVSIGVAKIGTIRGVADGATTTFAGETVLGSDTVAMVTWGGDANLDGKINILDYGQIDFNVGSSGSVFGWFNGDFNYDGKINILDYGIIDFNVSAQSGSF